MSYLDLLIRAVEDVLDDEIVALGSDLRAVARRLPRGLEEALRGVVKLDALGGKLIGDVLLEERAGPIVL